jgi:hypothetical protein
MKDMQQQDLNHNDFTHKYQDGLYYYENTRDAATNFFMDWLPKGLMYLSIH